MKTRGPHLNTTTYDDLSRKRSVSNPVGKRLTYSYDANSRRTQLQAADAGVFTYSYDNNGQLKLVKNPQGDRTTFVYDDDGRRTLKYLSNGSRTTPVYDTYDFVGNKLQIVESGGAVVTWSYDKTYQLTGEYRTGSNAYPLDADFRRCFASTVNARPRTAFRNLPDLARSGGVPLFLNTAALPSAFRLHPLAGPLLGSAVFVRRGGGSPAGVPDRDGRRRPPGDELRHPNCRAVCLMWSGLDAHNSRTKLQ